MRRIPKGYKLMAMGIGGWILIVAAAALSLAIVFGLLALP